MAPRLPAISSSTGWWKRLAAAGSSTATYATAAAAQQMAAPMRGKLKGDMVPVAVAVGMIAVSVSLGLRTAYHQVRHAPDVRVNKKLRETVPEVEYPEKVVEEADRFLGKSFFRKVAHVQQDKKIIPDPTRNENGARVVETLTSVGVDPKLHA